LQLNASQTPTLIAKPLATISSEVSSKVILRTSPKPRLECRDQSSSIPRSFYKNRHRKPTLSHQASTRKTTGADKPTAVVWVARAHNHDAICSQVNRRRDHLPPRSKLDREVLLLGLVAKHLKKSSPATCSTMSPLQQHSRVLAPTNQSKTTLKPIQLNLERLATVSFYNRPNWSLWFDICIFV
jgi:hypothetical protein